MYLVLLFLLIQIIIYLYFFPYPKMCKKLKHKDCGIVLGYPANDDGSISEYLKNRIDKAILLYKQGYIDYIIVSGSNVKNEYKEALVMKNYALKHDIDEEHIIVEDQAISTYHNLMYCKEIMTNNHFNDCYVITNSWHLRKANRYSFRFLDEYEMIKCQSHLSFYKKVYMHMYMHITTYIQLLKGYC